MKQHNCLDDYSLICPVCLDNALRPFVAVFLYVIPSVECQRLRLRLFEICIWATHEKLFSLSNLKHLKIMMCHTLLSELSCQLKQRTA